MSEINAKNVHNYNETQCFGRYPFLVNTPFPLPPAPGCGSQCYTPDSYSFGNMGSKYYQGRVEIKNNTGKAFGITAFILAAGALILSRGKFKPNGKGFVSVIRDGCGKLWDTVKHPVDSSRKALTWIRTHIKKK